MSTKQRVMKYQNSSGSFNFTRYKIHNKITGTIAEYIGEVATNGKDYHGSRKLTDRHATIQQKLNEFGNRTYSNETEKAEALQELDRVSEVLSMTLYRNSSMKNKKYAHLLQETKEKIASITELLRPVQSSSLEESVMPTPVESETSAYISQTSGPAPMFVQLNNALQARRVLGDPIPISLELQSKWDLLSASYQRAQLEGKIKHPLNHQYDVGMALMAFSGKTQEEHVKQYQMKKPATLVSNSRFVIKRPALRLAGAAAGVIMALSGVIASLSVAPQLSSKPTAKDRTPVIQTPAPTGRADQYNSTSSKATLSLK